MGTETMQPSPATSGEGKDGEPVRTGCAACSAPPQHPRPPLLLIVSDSQPERLRAVDQVGAMGLGPILIVSSVQEAQQVLGADCRPAPAVGRPVAGPQHGARSEVAPSDPQPPPRAVVPGITMDAGRHVLATAHGEVPLTPLEFAFLSELAVAPGQVRGFADLVAEVWGTDHVGDPTQVHSVVKRLRRKLELVRAPVLIEALRGVGFRLVHRRRPTPRPGGTRPGLSGQDG